MKWLNWKYGRQDGGYKVMLLAASKFLKFDLYLLHFPEGSQVGWHKDKVAPGFNHHRLNFTLSRAIDGGEQHTLGVTKKFWRFVLFRPDTQFHCLSHICEGRAYILSLGWLRKSS